MAVLAVVASIPFGRVATYGQVAALAGLGGGARFVGYTLGRSEQYGSYPCHRVVNHAGRPAPNWPEQQHLLEREGIQFKPNGCVDMKRFRWEC